MITPQMVDLTIKIATMMLLLVILKAEPGKALQTKDAFDICEKK